LIQENARPSAVGEFVWTREVRFALIDEIRRLLALVGTSKSSGDAIGGTVKEGALAPVADVHNPLREDQKYLLRFVISVLCRNAKAPKEPPNLFVVLGKEATYPLGVRSEFSLCGGFVGYAGDCWAGDC
jgi:hypothetical protein